MKVRCDCGLNTNEDTLERHKKGQLHKILMTYDYGNDIHGKSIINCVKCGKSLMMCGLPSHEKYCHKN